MDFSARPSVRPAVPHLLGRLWTDHDQTWQATSYYKMTINLYASESGWEPHWQGASGCNFYSKMILYCVC